MLYSSWRILSGRCLCDLFIVDILKSTKCVSQFREFLVHNGCGPGGWCGCNGVTVPRLKTIDLTLLVTIIHFSKVWAILCAFIMFWIAARTDRAFNIRVITIDCKMLTLTTSTLRHTFAKLDGVVEFLTNTTKHGLVYKRTHTNAKILNYNVVW